MNYSHHKCSCQGHHKNPSFRKLFLWKLIAGYCCGRKCQKEESNVPYAGTKKCKRPLIPIHFKSSSLTNILLIIISNPIIYFHLLITLWFCHTFCQHYNYIWSFKSWLMGRKSKLFFWNLSFHWIVHLHTTNKLTICQSAQVIIYSLPIPLWILWKRQVFHSMKSHILHSPSFHTVSLANPNIFCPVGLLFNHIIFCFFYYMPKMMMIREQ